VTSNRKSLIRRKLEERFVPIDLLIKDQSHMHAGHAGAADGRGHFDVRIVSEAFRGMSRIERHKSVYQALGDLLESDIHALRIQAFTPDEIPITSDRQA